VVLYSDYTSSIIEALITIVTEYQQLAYFYKETIVSCYANGYHQLYHLTENYHGTRLNEVGDY